MKLTPLHKQQLVAQYIAYPDLSQVSKTSHKDSYTLKWPSQVLRFKEPNLSTYYIQSKQLKNLINLAKNIWDISKNLKVNPILLKLEW